MGVIPRKPIPQRMMKHVNRSVLGEFSMALRNSRLTTPQKLVPQMQGLRPIRSESVPQNIPPKERKNPVNPSNAAAALREYPMSTNKRVWWTTMVILLMPIIMTEMNSSQNAGWPIACRNVKPSELAAMATRLCLKR